VKRILRESLSKAFIAFEQRFATTQSAAEAGANAATPHAHTCCEPGESLRDLVQSIGRQHAGPSLDPSAVNIEALGSRVELKSVRQFRNTWSKLSTNKQVTQALDQAPKNAGPINSHMLVLRSLALMRDISPDYLNRFVSYVDTLLNLEQSEKSKPLPTKPGLKGATDKKTASRRRQPRSTPAESATTLTKLA
jgi:hypothetical protein